MRSRLYGRLLSVVLLVLILPVAGLWSLGVFERELLVADERAIAVAARALAAALACPPAFDNATAAALVARVERPLAGRVRVFDGGGRPLVDTAQAGGPHAGGAAARNVRETWLYRVGAALWRLRRAVAGTAPRYGGEADRAAIQRALAGGYGAETGLSPDGRVTVMTVAVPVRGGGAVCGAVAVSRTTEPVLAALDRIRVDLFRIVLLSIVAAALVVLLLARGIVRPLRRLRDAADEVLAGARGRGAEVPGVHRQDEIGDLSRALAGLNERLERRLDELEAFASDVAHEVKNPLAAMRSAAELLRGSTQEGEIRQLTALIVQEVGRIDAVVGALQEVARLDAGRGRAAPPPALRLDELARRVADGWRERLPAGVALEVDVVGPVLVAIGAESAARVIENLLENAFSFTPAGGIVRLTLASRSGTCELTVEDSGPGVPEEHRGRIFERFFSWRPQEASRSHLGLGLGIARAIVERHGGRIELAAAGSLGGARFRVSWPVAR
ncbi:MAG: HAMP domain-containing protein [Thermoanaerobaculia bacterium]|nr:HAMP domain-containing protein [Thermoanaerobaculia bacterium]